MQLPFRVLDYGQVQVQLQVAPITAQNMAAHLEQETERIRGMLAGHKGMMAPDKAVVVVDGSVSLLPPPTARQLQGEWMKEHGDMLRLLTHRIGFVVPNAVLRHTITAVTWIAPMPIDMSTHASLELALKWAISEVDKLEGSVDPELRADPLNVVEAAKAAAMAEAANASLAPAASGNGWLR